MKKCLVLVICFIALLCSLYGCGGNKPVEYSGENPDLYTEAIFSIPGVNGLGADEPGLYAHDVAVIEEDEHGRKFFYYSEGTFLGNHSGYFFISQKAENGRVYFYPDYNFCIVTEEEFLQYLADEKEPDKAPRIELWEYELFFERIENLKQINDWGKEINAEKCVSEKVVLRKDDPLSDKEKNALYEEIYGKNERNGNLCLVYLSTDDEGKYLYFAYDWESRLDFRMVLIDGNNHYKEKFKSTSDYQAQLAAFKYRNDWKKS